MMLNHTVFRRPKKVAILIHATCAALVSLFLTLPAPAAEIEIKIDNFAFIPETVTVKAGTAIKWVNHDDIPHSIVANTGQFHSPALDTEESFTLTATAIGPMEYFCGLHPHMKGRVMVVP